MSNNHLDVSPCKKAGYVLSESGKELKIADNWDFLPSGDAAVTRAVKSKGSTWVVRVRKGRRFISKGIWAQKNDIADSQKEVELKRSTPAYAKRRKSDLVRREVKHQEYVGEFCNEVVEFLDFDQKYNDVAKLLAQKVTSHATPVGSGTVARTVRIPVAKRAEAAVIAWLRHQTTAYDSMAIARIKGERREVRRRLAAKSVELLKSYRLGRVIAENCPLKRALSLQRM